MQIDILTILISTLLITSSVISTLHLFKNFGILIASQTFLIQLAALLTVILFNQNVNHSIVVMTVMGVIILVGLLHILLLRNFGTDILLIISMILNMSIQEFWLAYPETTGGTGGLLLQGGHEIWPSLVLLILSLVFCGLYFFRLSKNVQSFVWKFTKKLKFKSALFGINIDQYYFLGFLLFAIIHSLIGVVSVQYLGYLSSESFSLAWTLTVLSIVVFSAKDGYLLSFLLAILYIIIKLLLRNSPNVSTTSANLFEVLFPSLLILIFVTRKVKTNE